MVTVLNHKVIIPEMWEILEMFTDIEKTELIYEKITDLFLQNTETFGRINAIEFEPEIFRTSMGFTETLHSAKFEYKFPVDPFTTIILPLPKDPHSVWKYLIFI
jgi:hypothetical protein